MLVKDDDNDEDDSVSPLLIFFFFGFSYHNQRIKYRKKENALTPTEKPIMSPFAMTSVHTVTSKSISTAQGNQKHSPGTVYTTQLSPKEQIKIEEINKITPEKKSMISAYRRLGYSSIALMKKMKELRPLFEFTLIPWQFKLNYTEKLQKNANTACKGNFSNLVHCMLYQI